MSRGLGKSQKLILEKAEELKAFYISDILPPNYKTKDYMTLYRAAVTLEKVGKILIDRRLFGSLEHRSRHGYGNCGLKALIHQTGTKIVQPQHYDEDYKCLIGNMMIPLKHLSSPLTEETVRQRIAVINGNFP